MLVILKIIIWLSLSILLYVYLGYPLAITIVAQLKGRKQKLIDSNYEPHVSMIIPARNEEKVIAKKLNNTLQLNYSKEKLEIIVISDNSLDKTDEIVRQFEADGVRLLSLTERHGKTWAQNIAAEKALGQVLIFSDANAMYIPDAVKHLAQYFQDPQVGAVSGELHYSNPANSAVGYEENLYWRWEKFIKRQEHIAGCILGANGSIYAVRKTDYIPLEKNIISDFIEPLEIIVRNKKLVYEPKAISYEQASLSFDQELARKRRIISRSIYSLRVHNHLLNPFRSGLLFFELLSHKVLRWLTPVFAVIVFIFTALLSLNGLYTSFFVVQTVFYALGLLGFMFKNQNNWPTLFFTPYYFCLLGYASIQGILDFLKGKSSVIWEPIRS